MRKSCDAHTRARCLTQEARRSLIHGLDASRRGSATDEVGHEPELRVRIPLSSEEVFISRLEPLLLLHLELRPGLQLILGSLLLLIELRLAQLPESARSGQLLLETLKTEVRPELPGPLVELRPELLLLKPLLLCLQLGLLVRELGLHTRLDTQLLDAKSCSEVLLLSLLTGLLIRHPCLKSRLLVRKTRLKSCLSTQLLDTEERSEILLSGRKTRLLIRHPGLHTCGTVGTELLLGVLERSLPPRGVDVTKLVLEVALRL